MPGPFGPRYDPYKDSKFEKGQTRGIFNEDFMNDSYGWQDVKKRHEKSDDKCRLWIVSPDVYKAAGQELGRGVSAGHLVLHQIYKDMHIRRTMRS